MKGKIPPTEVRDEHVLIDVRSPHEFATEKVPGARNIPLGDLEEQCGVLAEQPNLVLVCASGMRAQKARDILAERGIPAQVLEGGVKAWAQHGLPLQKGMASGISIERQVRIVAGFLAAMGGFLAILVHPWFAALSAFVGCGLVFAGVTDTCGMAMVLAKLPYNNRRGQSCCVPTSTH
jgi:rhodanese-related sulfurtransferase